MHSGHPGSAGGITPVVELPSPVVELEPSDPSVVASAPLLDELEAIDVTPLPLDSSESVELPPVEEEPASLVATALPQPETTQTAARTRAAGPVSRAESRKTKQVMNQECMLLRGLARARAAEFPFLASEWVLRESHHHGTRHRLRNDALRGRSQR